MTPAAYVEAQRVEAARRLLETDRRAAWTRSPRLRLRHRETMRRAFRARLRIAPASTAAASDRAARPRHGLMNVTEETLMDIAIPLFDGITALDAIGPYEVLSRLPGARVRFVAVEAGAESDRQPALTLIADEPLSAVPQPEIIMVPGGFGTRALMTPNRCSTGSAGARDDDVDDVGVHRLAAARRRGLLRGLEATTHWASLDSSRVRRTPDARGASSSRERSSPRPACRRGSTWRSRSPRASRATRSRRRFSSASSTTRSRRSTPARRRRPRARARHDPRAHEESNGSGPVGISLTAPHWCRHMRCSLLTSRR